MGLCRRGTLIEVCGTLAATRIATDEDRLLPEMRTNELSKLTSVIAP
jgi:hypothetical protein